MRLRGHLGAIALSAVVTLLMGCQSAPQGQASGKSETSVPIGHLASDPMFQFKGTWEGSVKNIETSESANGEGSDLSIKLSFGEGSVNVFIVKDGHWKEIKPGLFRMVQHGPQALVFVINSGEDNEGTRVESSTFTLIHDSPATMLVYWMRGINNIDLPSESPDHHFVLRYSGQLRMAN